MTEVLFLHTPRWQPDGDEWHLMIGNRSVARKAPAPSARDSKALLALAASIHRVGAELQRLHTEIRRIGVNVNQAAHAANDLRILASSRDAPNDWEPILAALSNMEQLPTERKLRELAETIAAALEQPAFRAAPLKVIEAVEKVLTL